MKILSLDPALNRCGWATVEFSALPAGTYPVPGPDGVVALQELPARWDETSTRWAWGFFDLTCMGYVHRLKEVVENLVMEVPGGFQVFLAEWPMFYDNPRGHQAAMRGDTINLAGVCAYTAGYFQLHPNQIKFITAASWKGSVSKEQTQQRFYRSFGIKNVFAIDHNAVDAAMLLLTYCKREKLITSNFLHLRKHIDPQAMPAYLPGREQRSQRFSR